ncbi:MAG: response regulator transcription factor [Lachnospiraceae bacterium]|nr:response regulator transcription factor [Lachnospiraceae bacterium]
MITLAIVEDEEIYTRQLREYLERYGSEKGVSFRIDSYADGEELTEEYAGGYDLLLMDIQMPFMDGMTAAEKIREQDRNVQIIFITNRTDYAIRGYEVDALDYIVKPVTYFAFSTKMDRALARIRQHIGKTVVLTLRTGMRRLRTSEIWYVETEGHMLVYHTEQGIFRLRGRLQSAEEELGDAGFFRCNKGNLVNLEHVDGVSDGMCLVKGEELLISRARRTDFMEALTSYFGNH